MGIIRVVMVLLDGMLGFFFDVIGVIGVLVCWYLLM